MKSFIQAYITDFTIDTIAIIMEHYNESSAEIKRFLVSLLAYEGLEFYRLSVFDKIKATEHMTSLQLDFDDACMYQAMQALKITTIASFDTDFDKIPSVKRLVSLP
ncbi:MAG: type II toxin-antitoxin system VapC family toxin [Candidatus Thorarchaeota archaeon]